jgi:hypothetical protein
MDDSGRGGLLQIREFEMDAWGKQEKFLRNNEHQEQERGDRNSAFTQVNNEGAQGSYC